MRRTTKFFGCATSHALAPSFLRRFSIIMPLVAVVLPVPIAVELPIRDLYTQSFPVSLVPKRVAAKWVVQLHDETPETRSYAASSLTLHYLLNRSFEKLNELPSSADAAVSDGISAGITAYFEIFSGSRQKFDDIIFHAREGILYLLFVSVYRYHLEHGLEKRFEDDFLHHTSPAVRQLFAQILATSYMFSSDDIALSQLLSDPDPAIRSSAQITIDQFNSSQPE